MLNKNQIKNNLPDSDIDDLIAGAQNKVSDSKVGEDRHAATPPDRQTDIAPAIPPNIPLSDGGDGETEKQTHTRLKLYLDVYTFIATREQINKGTFTDTHVAISDEMRTAMDKLSNIYVDGVVANDTDRNYKEIVNNALYEYLSKRFKNLKELV